MIISKEVIVTITNQGRYYASLGYGSLKQGTQIIVPVHHLPQNSNLKVLCKCDECEIEWKATYQSVKRQKDKHRCFSCNRKYIGTYVDTQKASAKNKERCGEKHPRWNPNKKAFAAYAYKVRRISEENYTKHKDLINPENLPRTLCGVDGGYQLDHKISLKWAFEHGVNPKIAGSSENLQILPWKHNLSKSYK